MSEEKESFLRFTLEESVWFQRGQEVKELLNISLDPDIVISENNGYISIDGQLELSGEYIREHSEAPDWEFPLSPKFIQTVEHRENNISEFLHRFPVDITIPLYRIKSMEEIEVIVDTFDYSFPERSCLKLTADLVITGLNDEETIAPHQEDNLVVQENREEGNFQEEIQVTIPPDSEEERDDMEEIEVVDHEQQEEHESTVSTEDIYSPFTVVARYEQEESEEETSTQDIETPPTLVRNLEPVEQTEQEPAYRYEEPAYEEEEGLVAGVTDEAEEEIEAEEEEPKLKKKKKISKKQGISITEFLARKEESEELTRLRVCIVQQGDTIETIADRYDVPILQLIKENQLDVNQDIYEGQILYIPNTVSNH